MPKEPEEQQIIDVELITREGIDEVVSFIPVLKAMPKQDIARWPEIQKRPGNVVVVALEPEYHANVVALRQCFTKNHFVQPFDWGHWQPTALKLFEEPDRLSKATLETCIKLITLHVRNDRFSGGHFGEMVSCGHIGAILKRLSQLRESVPAKQPSTSRLTKR